MGLGRITIRSARNSERDINKNVGFYLELIRTVFQVVDDEGKLRNRVVAFTSATAGEGVSRVVGVIARELALQTQRRVLHVESAALQKLYLTDPTHLAARCGETDIDNLLTLTAESVKSELAVVGDATKAVRWESASEFHAASVKALRWNFDYILIDCPAVGVSSDAAALAPLVDGLAVIVKAGETRRGQIQRCQKMLEAAGGNFLGFILNQRQYPVPNWLYRML